jgi:hypothetical protein
MKAVPRIDQPIDLFEKFIFYPSASPSKIKTRSKLATSAKPSMGHSPILGAPNLPV